MSKVICDLCGTSYPETASQCPICGCARPAQDAVVDSTDKETGTYTYVKGGRFSKANVRKRNQGIQPDRVGPEDPKVKSRKTLGLIIVLVSLILIVAFMIGYIIYGWIQRSNQNDPGKATQPPTVSCQEITVTHSNITMSEIGEVWMLNVLCSPVNTTDIVTYSSSDSDIVSVSDSGKLTCVAEGSAVITVKCGEQTAKCNVTCVFATEPVEPTVPPEGVHLNRMSIKADVEGFTWILYSGKVPVEDIIWTSDDPSVATFEDGVVVAVSEGITTVHAEYNGVVSSCEIVCDFADPTEGEDVENGEHGAVSGGEYKLYTQYGNQITFNDSLKAYDVTISVGESVGLFLKNDSGHTMELDWNITEGESCTVDGHYVTAVSSSSNCMVEVEFDGITYSCYVRTTN